MSWSELAMPHGPAGRKAVMAGRLAVDFPFSNTERDGNKKIGRQKRNAILMNRMESWIKPHLPAMT